MRALAGISFLVLIGLLTGASMLVYAAYVLIAVYWLTRYLSRQWADSLVAVRKSTAHEVEIGQTIIVSFKLENSGRLPIIWMLLEDALQGGRLVGPPPGLRSMAAICDYCHSRSVPQAALLQATALRRGYYQIGP